MKTAMSCGRNILSVVILCGFAATAGRSQVSTQSTGASTQIQQNNPHDPFGQNDQDKDLPFDMKLRQQQARESMRQKQLVADTDRLLELATRLHNDVAKTDKNILSLDVVKRADEIERLAHNVKERMKE